MKSNFFSLSVLALSFAGLISSCGGTGGTSTSDSTQVSVDSLNTSSRIDTTSRTTAEAVIAGTSSDTAVNGRATFTSGNTTGKVVMQIELEVPSKAGQSVAVHFHEHGDCGNKAEMAHGHWNPTNTNHGKWGEGSFHVGDIGNIKLDGNGKGSFTVESDLWSIGGSADKNIIGKSIIVHSGVDDYTTQPSGNSGSRIGCGVIR